MSESFQPALADYLRDESRRVGRADRIAFPRTETEVLAALAEAREQRRPITTQGARTGVTGGAVPEGGMILTLAHMDPIAVEGETLRVQPGATLAAIRAAGKRAGLTLCPETPVAVLADYKGLLDEVLIMTVHPGFGGQAFLEYGVPKIAETAKLLPGVDISVDGGINAETGARCAEAGANVLLAGSFLFKAADLRAAIAGMRAQLEPARKAGG